MSELINNREHRRNVLKQLIGELHNGKSVEEVKQKFAETFEGVSASEVSEVEQALIMDGMPVSEVQRLCDVHAAVFKGSIEDIHKSQTGVKGHPADIMKQENRAIEKLIAVQIKPDLKKLDEGTLSLEALKNDLNQLWQVDIHYMKKENVLFPYLEKYGITAPPKVMWGVDDEIRGLIKKARGMAEAGDTANIKAVIEEAVAKITEMIFKEENILLPMMMETLTPDEWKRIAEESRDLGYCLIDDAPEMEQPAAEEPVQPAEEGIVFPTGSLNPGEITAILNTLPFDLTFVDSEGTVKYFSQGKDRIFPRTKAVIGRNVTNCHPPASVHIVESVVAELKSGAKEHEDFWIRIGERFVHIRYYAVRGEKGEYLGTLEVTQDIAPIQAIKGEKRLMSSSEN
ncbi:MAG: DUF438 domain-containing protein [Burkholderiales bacterium]